jgi:hypothetical protein
MTWLLRVDVLGGEDEEVRDLISTLSKILFVKKLKY